MTLEATLHTDDVPRAPIGPWREFWGYFSANKGAVAGLVVVALLLGLAAFANVLAPYPPDLTNNAVFLKPPAWQSGGSWAYPLGTDAIGRDMLSRLVHGARLSLLIGMAVVAISIVAGIALGLVAGYARGVTEIAIMRLMDIILTLPSLLLAIVIVAILGPGLMNAMLAVAVVGWFRRVAVFDVLGYTVWRLAARGPVERRVRWTVRLLEWRGWFCGRPRPPAATLSDWFSLSMLARSRP